MWLKRMRPFFMLFSVIALALPLLTSEGQGASFQMRRDENGRYLYMTGSIIQGDVGRLHQQVRTHRPPFLRVSSNGGDAQESLKLAEYLGRNRIEVRLLSKDYCISACAIMIMGSPNRLMGPRAVIGLHAPYYAVQRSLRGAGVPAQNVGRRQKAAFRKKLYGLAIQSRISQRYVDTMLKFDDPRGYYAVNAPQALSWRVVQRILPR